jgi:serine/threonine-protein kinase
MLETAPSDRYNSAAAVLQAIDQKSSAKSSAKSSHTAIQPAPSAPPPVVAKPASKPVIPRSNQTPWILSATIGTQFTAAFLLGVEAMLLWKVNEAIGVSLIGTQASLITFAAVIFIIVILRITTILDNKDLFVFVNLLSFAAVWGIQFFKIISQFQNLPQWIEILSLCGVAGFGAIAMMAALRLVFQLLYSLL